MMRGKLNSGDLTSPVLAARGHFSDRYVGIRSTIFDYETDAEAAAALVPTLLEIPLPAVASLRFHDVSGGPMGPYREVAQVVFVQHAGVSMRFFTRVIVDSPRAYEMYVRRGIPVSFGLVHLAVHDGVVAAWAERPVGVRLCSGLMSIDTLESDSPQTHVGRLISASVGRDATRPDGPGFPVGILGHHWTHTTVESWRGEGGCTYTGQSLLDPLHLLPVKRPLPARWCRGDGVASEEVEVLAAPGQW